MKKDYAELLDSILLKLCTSDARERGAAIVRIVKTVSKLKSITAKDLDKMNKYNSIIKSLHFKYLGKIEKLITKHEKGANLDDVISVETLKTSKLKSLYTCWYILYEAFREDEEFIAKYDDLIENTDWLFRYEKDADEYEYYDEEDNEVINQASSELREDGSIPSPFSDEVLSRFRKNKRNIRDVSQLKDGRSDAAFEQMLNEMRDSLLDIGEMIFEDENVVHRLVAELYKADPEMVGDIVGSYFDKLKKQYQSKDYYQYLARYCNYFPAKSLSGLSPIEALYSINKK